MRGSAETSDGMVRRRESTTAMQRREETRTIFVSLKTTAGDMIRDSSPLPWGSLLRPLKQSQILRDAEAIARLCYDGAKI
jgi:hypothetical protein